jgi:hypothetical protein
MSNVSLARIMYGSSEGPRSDYGPHSSANSLAAAPSFAPSDSGANASHDALTLESLLQKAWEALSAKR